MNIIYTPVLYTSYSGGCLPGTINFNPTTTIICLRDMCVSLAQQGFQNIFIIPGHGGTENMKTLENNLFIMIRENPVFEKVMVVFTPFWDFAPRFRKHLDDGDGHAGNAETSMIMYLHPELVKDEIRTDGADVLSELKKDPDYYQKYEKNCDYPEVLARITQKDSVRIGVMGEPRACKR